MAQVNKEKMQTWQKTMESMDASSLKLTQTHCTGKKNLISPFF